MFLHHLTKPQKKAFLPLALEFIAVDQHRNSAELHLLDQMKREMGIPVGESTEPPAEPVDRKQLAKAFDDRRSRAVVLLELIGLGYADGEFTDREYAFIRDLAQAIGVSKGERLAMENWVVRQLELFREATEFWTEEL